MGEPLLDSVMMTSAMLVTKLFFDRMMERDLWYWLVMMLNLAVSDMFEDMCGYLMMNRDDRGSWRRLLYNTVVRRLPRPEGLMLMSMKGTSVTLIWVMLMLLWV